jgi:hypothetical protein
MNGVIPCATRAEPQESEQIRTVQAEQLSVGFTRD